MIISMFLAHLVADYVLQWDKLAYLKGRELKGVLYHGAIVTVVTVLFALPFDVDFLPWALFISGVHILVDAAPLWLIPALGLKREGLFELVRFLIDQVIHLAVIVLALALAGYLPLDSAVLGLLNAVQEHRTLTLVMGYVFVAMPAWILVEFIVYGLFNQSAPDFPVIKHNKYIGTLERWLMLTFVLLGQFGLVALVAAPRLVLEGPQVLRTPRTLIYVAELLASVTLTLAVGLALRQL